ncbi:(2Fe-2S)-binding protein [Sciscionella marina]|uniref:(2Fe-2S)-binding protein n=1 Tax=Sciscionella marina TaxID=508770 RepID=UPI000369D613|nr:(2Fe-2S)-binding protein [Sciscionella marina]
MTELADLTDYGPYFTVRTGAGSGPRLAELYRSPGLVRATIEQTGAALGGVPDRVAAGTWHLACCAYLVSPPLGGCAHGELPLLDPEHTWWNTSEPVRLSTLEPTWLPASADGMRTVLDTHLVPLLHSVRAAVKLAEPILWGNLASSLVGAARVLGAEAPWPLVRDLLDGLGAGELDERLHFRRRSCCLFYRVPGGGYCGDCPLG